MADMFNHAPQVWTAGQLRSASRSSLTPQRARTTPTWADRVGRSNAAVFEGYWPGARPPGMLCW
ncbi:DUF6225 family protein [Streptomyces sp. NPDC093108]|uniref:DUF6225 family protein n=1 Tax=Streptomyces sp. NPDC093108 TaxID=3366030 RepID=UPI00382EB1B2